MEIRQDSKLMWVSCLECWHRKTGEHQTPVFERLYSSIQLINNYALNNSSYGSAFPIECYLPARYHYKSFAELRLECKSKTNTETMYSCIHYTILMPAAFTRKELSSASLSLLSCFPMCAVTFWWEIHLTRLWVW